MMIGYVYKITNKLNGKVYVGQTVSNPLKRFDHHYSRALRGDGSWQSDILKFGKENFELDLICEVQDENRLELRKKLISLEGFFIDYYDSIKNGYNKVKQKNVEKEMDYNISETVDKINIIHENIKEDYINNVFNRSRKDVRPVFQYDKEGNFIRGFDSIILAEKTLGLNRGNIYASCKTGKQMSGGFIWRW